MPPSFRSGKNPPQGTLFFIRIPRFAWVKIERLRLVFPLLQEEGIRYLQVKIYFLRVSR